MCTGRTKLAMQLQPIAVLVLALCLQCASFTHAQSNSSGSTVGGPPARVNASNIPYLPAQTEAQQRRNFDQSSFSFGFESFDAMTPGGNLSGLFINNDQALATLPNGGVGQNLVSLAPCAVNQPHVHPRGTEISHITQGELLFGFIEENANKAGTVGGRFINATLTKGQTQIIPQGLIHFAQNLQCEPAQFIASFPTSDPGTVTILTEAFQKLPAATLRATLGLDDSIIQAIVQKVNAVSQANPSLDIPCLNRCGIPVPAEFYSYSPSGLAASGY